MYAISNSQYNLIIEVLHEYIAGSQPTDLKEYNRVRVARLLLQAMAKKQEFDKSELKKIVYVKR